MKTHLRFIFVFLALVLSSGIVGQAFAQRPLKGRVVYNISYPGSNVDLAELQQLPVRAVILTKNNLVRTELTGENAGLFQIKISDGNTNEVSTMLEIMREKYVIKKQYQEIQNALRNMAQPELEFTDETKEILGYTCRKVIARTTDMFGIEHESEIFYTNDIPGDAFNFDSPYNEIPGLMLEYEIRVGQLNIRYEAQSVNKRLFVGGRNFYVTRDYQEITYDELTQKLQGNL
jgi:GLPGLI family protein